ncbi:MAG: cell division protein FtsH, partial [Candidatus Marinimicrobia bacterium]|nr:cell division protein FtsH [Candidatus Neomarinimicrobiota bacterium]
MENNKPMLHSNEPKKNPKDNPRQSKGNQQPGKKKNNQDNEFKWKKASKTSLMWIIIIISSIFLIQILGTGTKEEITIEFQQYKDLLTSGQISEATIIERQFHGTLKEQTTLIVQGRPTDVKKFNFVLPPNYDQYMLADWEQYNLRYNFQEQTVEWTAYLFQILPWLLFIGIWIFFMRRMQGQNNKGIFGFGKSKARL